MIHIASKHQFNYRHSSQGPIVFVPALFTQSHMLTHAHSCASI